MVTPETGIVQIKTRSGVVNYSIYSSDVIAAPVTWNLNGVAAAGGQSFVIVPDDGIISDVSIATGQTVSTVGIVQLNDQNVGSVFSWANQVNTLATRVSPQIQVRKGMKLAIIQA